MIALLPPGLDIGEPEFDSSGSWIVFGASTKIVQDSLLGVETSGAGDQLQCECLIDAPIATVERVGQRGTGWRRTQPLVKELWRVGGQRGFDVAQALTPSQLRKGKDTKQLRAPPKVTSSFTTAAAGACPTLARSTVRSGAEVPIECFDGGSSSRTLRLVSSQTIRIAGSSAHFSC